MILIPILILGSHDAETRRITRVGEEWDSQDLYALRRSYVLPLFLDDVEKLYRGIVENGTDVVILIEKSTGSRLTYTLIREDHLPRVIDIDDVEVLR